MRKKEIVFLIGLIVFNFSFVAMVFAQDEIGSWSMNEGTGTVVNDGTTYQNNGIAGDYYPNNADGNTGPIWVDGIEGKALQFDGVDDYVKIEAYNNFVHAGNFSVEAWVKTTGTSGNIVSRGMGVSVNYGWNLQLSNEGDGKAVFHLYDQNQVSAKSDIAINDGQWHHIVGVRNGSLVIIYVDALQRGIADASRIGNIDYNYYLMIGAAQDGITGNFNGVIDEVVMYNKALTSQEIAAHKNFNTLPVANAGVDQTVHFGSIVTLDGSGSYDPYGNLSLTYQWRFLSVPQGSVVSLSDSRIVNPTFIPDFPGDYILRLVVTDTMGAVSQADKVIISTVNSTPIAEAGQDQLVAVIGTIVQLNGNQSYDPDGDSMTYHWRFVSMPAGSTSLLSSADTAAPAFIADVHGDYVLELSVRDAWSQSVVDIVKVGFENIKPVANAGTSQSAVIGDTVILNGGGSFDTNRDSLAYKWAFSSVPTGSFSVIADSNVMTTNFIPDLPGTYVVQLVANDGLVDSDPSNIQVEAITLQTATTQSVQTVETQISVFPPAVFQNNNMQNALSNKINAALGNIEAGNYVVALGQLQNDILKKTDGWATSGAPDKNDWIKDSATQQIIYPYVLEAIARVKQLMQ